MPEEELKVTIRLKDFATRGMRKFHGTVTRVAAKVRAKLAAVRSAVFGLKGALIALGGTMVAKSFIDAGAQLEKFRTQLVAVMDQNEKLADSTLKWVRDFAALTPHATADVIQAFVSLQAAGVQANQQMMDTLGNVAYVFDRNIADVSLGLVSMEKEIFKRLGIQWEIVGQKAKIWSGKTVVHTNKAAESMRKGILEIWEKKFPGAMKRAEGDYKGLTELLKSQWWEFRANVMQAGVMDFIKRGLKVATDRMTRLGASADSTADKITTGFRGVTHIVAAIADSVILLTHVTKAMGLAANAAFVIWNVGFSTAIKNLRTLLSVVDKVPAWIAPIKLVLKAAGTSAGELVDDLDGVLDTTKKFSTTAKENVKLLLADMKDFKWGKWQDEVKGFWDEYDKGVVAAKKNAKDLNDFNAALLNRMVGPMKLAREEMRDAMEKDRLDRVKMIDPENDPLYQSIKASIKAQEILNDELQTQKRIIEDTRPQYDALRVQFEGFASIIGSSIVGAIDDAIEGTFRWQDALRGLMKDLGLAITRMLIMQAIGAIGGAIGGMGGATTSFGTGINQSASPLTASTLMAKGGYIGSGVHIPRAQKGRVIKGRQMVAVGDNTTGDNEEYIMPAVKGPDGTLGVKGHGGGVTINVSAVDEDGVAKFFYKHRDKLMSMFNLGMTESPGMTPAGG